MWPCSGDKAPPRPPLLLPPALLPPRPAPCELLLSDAAMLARGDCAPDASMLLLVDICDCDSARGESGDGRTAPNAARFEPEPAPEAEPDADAEAEGVGGGTLTAFIADSASVEMFARIVDTPELFNALLVDRSCDAPVRRGDPEPACAAADAEADAEADVEA